MLKIEWNLKISKECIEDSRQLQIEKQVNLNMAH